MLTTGILLLRRFNNSISCTCKRNLFSENLLGITRFKKKREKECESDSGKKLKIRIRNVCDDPNLKVLTHQIKKMCYLGNNAEDACLFKEALEKYCKYITSESIIFKNFNMGPEIMKMYYVLNMPREGMMLLQNPVTSVLFYDVKSYVVLQDLLYNNGMYDEVVEIFNAVREKQIQGRRLPFLNYMLYQAACYKLNTSKSYNDALKTLEEFNNYMKKPIWPVLMYTMINALENGAPELPLTSYLGSDAISVNIKLAALIKTGAVSKAVQFFVELPEKSVVIKSVATDLYSMLENFDENELHDKNILNYKDKILSHSFQNKTFEQLAAETMYSFEKFNFFAN